MHRRRPVRVRRNSVESLESRVFLHGADASGFTLEILPEISQPVLSDQVTSEAQAAGASVSFAAPLLNSLPGSADTLYLDFDGHFQASWGSYSNITTPEFNLDGVSGFNAAELQAIQDIWAQVSEDFAPYNINVSTVEPASFANGVALRVAIGGNSNWLGSAAGGVAYVDSYTNSIANTVYVFPDHLAKTAKYIAEATSHEAGHAFGLQHQSLWQNGSKTEYYAGPGDGRAPIMGNSYYATRGLWWNGTTTSATTIQDDMAVLAKSANTFGYRVDDYGSTAAAAFTLSPTGASVGASGIIGLTSDKDYFRFDTGAGNVSLGVTVAQFNNLDARLELWTGDGLTLLASSDPSGFNASISQSLSAGSYLVVVASHGGYGDVGQYTVSGTIVNNPNAVAAPTSFSAVAIGTDVSLSWADNAGNETAYVVQRSTSATFSTVTTFNLGANATGMADSGLSADTVYYYRVQAVNATDASGYANGSAATVPVAPVVTASAVSSSQIDVSWTNPNAETSFLVERSTNQVDWATIAAPAANTTSLSDTGRSALTTYYYRVTAVNAAGSTASDVVNATTPAAPVTPAAPSNLRYSTLTKSNVVLLWNDNAGNETNYVVQRSTNGGSSWSTVATLGANVTTYNNTGLSKKRTYVYRVYASNAAGNSGYSNTLTVTTPARTGVIAAATTAIEDVKKKLSALA